jgi:hypothetical protein
MHIAYILIILLIPLHFPHLPDEDPLQLIDSCRQPVLLSLQLLPLPHQSLHLLHPPRQLAAQHSIAGLQLIAPPLLLYYQLLVCVSCAEDIRICRDLLLHLRHQSLGISVPEHDALHLHVELCVQLALQG